MMKCNLHTYKHAFSHLTPHSYVWGRGALDVKFSVAAILEAVAALLQSGFSPKRTIIISFGSDEEVRQSCGVGCVSNANAPWQ